ncbi:DEAD/DEAH box helicase domain [Dillenia turbinata]|uniref:DEAD-box ATP-dependent RNA helicase 7 n=1 Tax=Dillenia turbinata TaxID=194707 RepID=A0AAN8VBK3_9MAGN
MPSLFVSDAVSSPEAKEKKKEKKIKKNTMEIDSQVEINEKKEKKSKKKKNLKADSDSEELDSMEEKQKSSKKKEKDKKRKAVEIVQEEEEKSETSSELYEPMNAKKKQKLPEEEEAEEEESEEENPNSLSNFRISENLKNKLNERGIKALFPIQALTFDILLDGSDLIGRARTGQGKTLAFVLPILESLTNGPKKMLRKMGYGRAPSVLVLLPTRELAQQVYADFEVYGKVVGLTSCCVYGGVAYQTQELRRGVDIVVGTPGRVKDLVENGKVDFSSLLFRVLDEADEMLKMGFVDDVEKILEKVGDKSKVQTLLFSATVPEWVNKISSRFLKPNKENVDLVGNEKIKASISVRHIVMPCASGAISDLIPDIIRCYSSGGRTIIFCEKKESTSDLAGRLPGARAIHGDIQQKEREKTLAGFRSGKFMVLVATSVAARGLDIPDVQLVIQCEPPREVEAYIHRSGRTGRAGNTGVAVLLYDPRRHNVSRLERESGVKFEHLSAPQPADVAKAVGVEAAEAIILVSDSVVPAFKSAAEELLKTSGLSAVELLAKALAKASGYSEIKSRSLLTGMEKYVTVLLEVGRPIYSPGSVFGTLRRFLPEDKVNALTGLSITADGSGAVFDVPSEDLDEYLAGQENAANVSLEVVKKLPPLREREQSRGPRFGSGGGFGDRRGGGFGGRSSGGRGGGRFGGGFRSGRGRGFRN